MPFDRFISFWKLQIGGWLVYLLMIYVSFLTVAPEGSYGRLFRIKLARAIIGFFLTCVMRYVYRRFENLTIMATVLVVLTTSVIFGLVWTFLEMAHSQWTNSFFVLSDALARSPRTALDYGLTLTAWSALYFGIKYWLAWQREREAMLEAVALANKAQLEMLRYQINPHFLFNSLNSIRASVDEDARRAKQMITQLAEFLRYSLLTNNSRQVAVRDEIEAVKNYLAIEKIRFEEKLETEFVIDEKAEDMPVPPFLLNPLVENAVKHGLNGGNRPLKILVKAQLSGGSLFLEVANTGSLSANKDGTKVGLKNVRERLEKIFGTAGSFSLQENDGWVRAQIRINRNEI